MSAALASIASFKEHWKSFNKEKKIFLRWWLIHCIAYVLTFMLLTIGVYFAIRATVFIEGLSWQRTIIGASFTLATVLLYGFVLLKVLYNARAREYKYKWLKAFRMWTLLFVTALFILLVHLFASPALTLPACQAAELSEENKKAIITTLRHMDGDANTRHLTQLLRQQHGAGNMEQASLWSSLWKKQPTYVLEGKNTVLPRNFYEIKLDERAEYLTRVGLIVEAKEYLRENGYKDSAEILDKSKFRYKDLGDSLGKAQTRARINLHSVPGSGKSFHEYNDVRIRAVALLHEADHVNKMEEIGYPFDWVFTLADITVGFAHSKALELHAHRLQFEAMRKFGLDYIQKPNSKDDKDNNNLIDTWNNSAHSYGLKLPELYPCGQKYLEIGREYLEKYEENIAKLNKLRKSSWRSLLGWRIKQLEKEIQEFEKMFEKLLKDNKSLYGDIGKREREILHGEYEKAKAKKQKEKKYWKMSRSLKYWPDRTKSKYYNVHCTLYVTKKPDGSIITWFDMWSQEAFVDLVWRKRDPGFPPLSRKHQGKLDIVKGIHVERCEEYNDSETWKVDGWKPKVKASGWDKTSQSVGR